MSINRRTFVKSGLFAASAATALPAFSYARVMGANDQIRAAVVGLKGRGNDHIKGLRDHVVAICDCDQVILNNTKVFKDTEKKVDKPNVDRIVDFRRLLDRDDIDVISVATPNHTHSIISILAAAAGKDVYCEKPVSHNVWEGRQLAVAATKFDRIIQCGTQSRSSPSLQEAVHFVQDGQLGKIRFAVGTCYKPRKSIGKLENPLSIPKTIDYDLWCGPAEKRLLYRPNLHYDWHWDFNTGNGDMGNQGIHQMDIARWFLGYDQISPRILSIGGRLGYDDAGDTPNTQTVLHDYPDAPLIFETRGLPKSFEFQKQGWGENMDDYRGSRIGVIVQCEQGYIVIPSYSSATAFDNEGNPIKKWNGGGDHYANFIEAVRSRDAGKLNAPIVEGHLSSALCHTGGISHQVGEKVDLADVRSHIKNESPEFRNSVERMIQHLEANQVPLESTKLTLGADLKMDPDSETVLNNESASKLTSREYRKGYEVPDLSGVRATS